MPANSPTKVSSVTTDDGIIKKVSCSRVHQACIRCRKQKLKVRSLESSSYKRPLSTKEVPVAKRSATMKDLVPFANVL